MWQNTEWEGESYMFPIITNEKQKLFEKKCIKNNITVDATAELVDG